MVDPVQVRDLKDLATDRACPKKFAYRRRAEAASGDRNERAPEHAVGRRLIREVVRGALGDYLSPRGASRVVSGQLPRRGRLTANLGRRLELLTGGRSVDWKGASERTELERATDMVLGGLRTVGERASEILASALAAVVPLEVSGRRYCLEGTLDLVYRPRVRDGRIGLAVWHFGAQRPDSLVMSHGPEMGAHLHILGHLSSSRWAEKPPRIDAHVVHLADFTPYTKAGAKRAKDPELAQFFGVAPGDRVKFAAGDLRGPGWYSVHRPARESDRFKASIRNTVSTVRLGRFAELIGEGCRKCPFRDRCLTDGSELVGEEKRALELALRGVTYDGLEDVAA